MSNLAPGDMCVVVKDLIINPVHRATIGGKTVILLEEVVPGTSLQGWLQMSPFWAPYWRCSGLPPRTVVSHKILQKIPPAPLETEEHKETLNV